MESDSRNSAATDVIPLMNHVIRVMLSTQRASQYEKETNLQLTSCRGQLAPMWDFRRQAARNRLTHGKRRTDCHNKLLEFQRSLP